MMNEVVLVGRLTKDPELRYTPEGHAVSTITLAVNRDFKNGKGENEADFPQVVIWRKNAENLCNFQRKGALIGITGRIQTRSFEGQDGKRQYITEVVAEKVKFLEPKGAHSGEGAPAFNPASTQNTSVNEDPFANNGQPIDISDDDLPF
jgi:single-strand DNA-binding protein